MITAEEAGSGRRGNLRSYALVTGAYWADTLTDGAIRMLVLFYFYELGYSPFQVAMLFVFYEVFGIITNLAGGFVAARFGLKHTLVIGLGTQLTALCMLGLAPTSWLVVPYVMVTQALSGIAKDLTKMSSKSAVKLVAPDDSGSLYKWVAVLTGSKNALKGVGFFLGGLLLTVIGFQPAIMTFAVIVAIALVTVVVLLRDQLGTPDAKAKFSHMFSNNRAVNVLAGARVFLFASRDVWFVVALPVYLRGPLGWTFWQVGIFMAVWVIGYGVVQAMAPSLMRRGAAGSHPNPDGGTAQRLAFVLALVPAVIAAALSANLDPTICVVVGLIIFGAVFALNSAVHSYLILAYAQSDKVAMNVGFYYMANACGRLAGTVLSGLLYQWNGMPACLWASALMLLATAGVSRLLPRRAPMVPQPA